MDVLPPPCARIVSRGCQTHPLALLLPPSEARVDSVCVDDCNRFSGGDLKAKPKAAGEYNCRARRLQRGARRRGYSLEAHGGPWDCRASALAVLLSNAEGKCGPLWICCASGSPTAKPPAEGATAASSTRRADAPAPCTLRACPHGRALPRPRPRARFPAFAPQCHNPVPKAKAATHGHAAPGTALRACSRGCAMPRPRRRSLARATSTAPRDRGVGGRNPKP